MKFLITEKQLLLIENKLNLRSRAKNQLDDAVQYYSEKILKGEIMDNEPFPENVIKNLPKEILQKYIDFYVQEIIDDVDGFLELQQEIEMQYDDLDEYQNPIDKIFNFLPNNIKDLYVNEKLKREDWLTIDEFNYINDDLKKEYIKNRSTLFNDEYDILSDNMKKWYIDYKLSDGYKFQSISDKFFNEFSDEQKVKYFNLMKTNKFYPKYEDFTPYQKEYFRSKQLLENKLNLKSRANEIKKEKEEFVNSILSKPIETISFDEIEKLQSLFYTEKIHNRIMDKIFSYLYNKYLKEENFSVRSVERKSIESNYIRLDFYKNNIRHIIDLSMDNFYGIFYLNHWNSKEKIDNYTDFKHTSHNILKDMFDYIENLIKNES